VQDYKSLSPCLRGADFLFVADIFFHQVTRETFVVWSLLKIHDIMPGG
jgi:hypothetical protein